MTLPPHYTSSAQYLEDALSFLKEHQWIYNYPNTHILVEGVFSKIPAEWAAHFAQNPPKTADLNRLALCETDDETHPQSLGDFFARLRGLKPDLEVFPDFQEVDFPKNSRIGAKKKHEIVRLAALVKKVCNERKLNSIIDVGSGLGYLSQLLSENLGFRVLGIEGCEEKVKLARAHQDKFHAKSKETVKYVEHYITGGSAGYLGEAIGEMFPDRGELCVVGLHACADLSVTVLDLFLELNCTRSLVIMPCCYHRLEAESHFPISQVLTRVFAKLKADVFLRRPFLRLACQQANAHWKDMSQSEHEVHARNCLFRAVLQEVAEEENLELSRLKRKPGGRTATCDIQSLIANFRSSYSLTTKGAKVDGGVIEEKISAKWARHEQNLVLIEALTAFQAAVQSVCENIVLLDRVEYLRENGVNSCRVYKVTDERVSPRCFALVANLRSSMDSKDCEYSTKLSFLTEWYDYDSDFTKKLRLSYFPYDDTVELFDVDTNRIFLRRAVCEGVQQKDLFLGNRIRVFGRQLDIKDYLDCFTEKLIGKTRQHTFVILKREVLRKMGDVITEIQGLNLQICRMRMCHLTRKEAMDFYEKQKGDVHMPFVIENIISGPILAMELVGENAVERFEHEVGNGDPEIARKEQPNSLRARYGVTRAANAFHIPKSAEEVVEESLFFFPQGIGRKSPPKPLAKFINCTCCVVKPHAIAEGKLGRILSSIIENELFEISGLQMVYLSNPDAEEFLEVYKGVVSDFHALLLTFLNGPCVVLEICGAREDINVHQEFRKFAGPSDSDIARQIRPNTLRGLYGVDRYKNAVHCTDLPEDTILELEYFFKELH